MYTRIMIPVAWALVTLSVPALLVANPPPPANSDPISITPASPSIGFGNTPGDIYGEQPGLWVVAQGWDVGGPGPILHAPDFAYGLTPVDNNDGHSNGEWNPWVEQFIYFSGSPSSVGMPLTAYNTQSGLWQAEGDRFVANGIASPPPAVAMATGIQANVFPSFPGPLNLLSANQTRFNEIPSVPAMVPNPGVYPPDDMDALELTLFDINGDKIPDRPVYFTVDRPTAMALGVSPADVLFSPPGGMWNPWFPAPQLGLAPVDDVDALAVFDLHARGIPEPGIDYALFSLAPGSPTLDGADGVAGTADDYSAADIFVTNFNGAFMLYLPASAIGMLPTDDVDALDVESVFTDNPPVEVFDWWQWLLNFDVWIPPWTPLPPNDFHIELEGVPPELVGELWIDMFPMVVVEPMGLNGTRISWSGAEALPGTWIHFGFVILDQVYPTQVRWYFTRDGEPIIDVPWIFQRWDWWANPPYTGLVDVVQNMYTEEVAVQRFTTVEPVEPVKLPD
ncbi:MAG: hypothetical protein JXO22_16415, partial [Phycisphaerae bacterium]|nr:hypothetical protein [Phycisphaerae bacterium]